MANIIAGLLDQHAQLRRSMETMNGLLGEAKGVGWDDQTDLDLPRLREVERRFSAALKAHERAEEEGLSGAIGRVTAEGKRPVMALEKEHKALNEIFQLLQSVTCLCDGRHVYALRTVLSRAADLLEQHLAYEERALFPLLEEYREQERRIK